mmetsp:Transcript_36516/g.113647  ORF Transcript_36516/g.113647 Transcript_36516/m.113647 type:complete len:217 (-) Transcript_36516:353-1003(-)
MRSAWSTWPWQPSTCLSRGQTAPRSTLRGCRGRPPRGSPRRRRGARRQTPPRARSGAASSARRGPRSPSRGCSTPRQPWRHRRQSQCPRTHRPCCHSLPSRGGIAESPLAPPPPICPGLVGKPLRTSAPASPGTPEGGPDSIPRRRGARRARCPWRGIDASQTCRASPPRRPCRGSLWDRSAPCSSTREDRSTHHTPRGTGPRPQPRPHSASCSWS